LLSTTNPENGTVTYTYNSNNTVATRTDAKGSADESAAISGAAQEREFLFVGDDRHCPPDDWDLLRQEFRPVLKRLGLYHPGFGWHAFRRQNITWRQEVGGATPLAAERACTGFYRDESSWEG
jgi:YD repeat-containing protein